MLYLCLDILLQTSSVSLYSWYKSASSAASASLCDKMQLIKDTLHVGEAIKSMFSFTVCTSPSQTSSFYRASPPSLLQIFSPALLRSPPPSSLNPQYPWISSRQTLTLKSATVFYTSKDNVGSVLSKTYILIIFNYPPNCLDISLQARLN